MLFLLLVPLVLTAEWKLQSQADGMTLETKPAPSGDYETVRVRSNVKVPPQLMADAIWGPPGAEGVANKKAVKVHEVLLDKPNERIVYEVVSAALISDRDYILHLTRLADGEVHEIRWTNIADPRRPPQAGRIRAPIVSGSVVIEPGEAGGSTVTYEVLTDMGGALPAWAAKSAMRDAAIEWMKVMDERGKKKLAQ
jgi:hypothetical protein